MITIELLDGLLSGSGQASAESQYNKFEPSVRMDGLYNVVMSLSSKSSSETTSADVGRSMLCCVLLRREISSIVGVCMGSASEEGNANGGVEGTVLKLKGMAGGLMDVFAGGVCGDDGVRRQMGFVVAEICCSVTLVESMETETGGWRVSGEVMGSVLEKIGSGCMAGDKQCLRVLCSLAERSPISLWKSNSSGQLERVLEHSARQLGDDTSSLGTVQLLLEAVTQTAAASSIAQQHAATLTSATSASERLRRTIELQATQQAPSDPAGLSVAAASPAAALGRRCLPLLLRHLSYAPRDGSGAVLAKCMECLSHCAGRAPSVLAADPPLLTAAVSAVLRVANAAHGSDGRLALAAVEVLRSLAEVPQVALMLSPAAARGLWQACMLGDGSGNAGVLAICAHLIAAGVGEDVDGWLRDPPALHHEAELWEDDDDADYADSLLRSLLASVPGSSAFLAPAILPLVQAMLEPSSSWQHVRAALSILQLCLATLPSSFAPHLPAALHTATAHLHHSNPRVVFQALQLIGAICQSQPILPSDHAHRSPSTARPLMHLRRDHGTAILQSLTRLLSLPEACNKVLAHACATVVSYCRGDGHHTVSPEYLTPSLPALLHALTTGPLSRDIHTSGTTVLYHRAVNAIACCADAVGTSFIPFYNSVMPGLWDCAMLGLNWDGVNLSALHNGDTPSHDVLLLRGAAIEAITIIGTAIDQLEVFLPDAEKITTFIMALLKSSSNLTHVPKDQLLAASARIASVMGERYAPFIPHVLPHLLTIVKQEADVSVTDATEASLETTNGTIQYDHSTGSESMTVSLPGIGIKQIVLNTTQINEKSLAARAIYEHADSMAAAFGPYAHECIQTLLPMLVFKYSAEVRTTAAQALAPLFDSLCEFHLSYSQEAPQLHTQSPHHTSHPQAAQCNTAAAVFTPIVLSIAKQMQLEDNDDFETMTALSDALSSLCYSAYVHTHNDGTRLASLTLEHASTLVQHLIQSVHSCLQKRANTLNLLTHSIDPDQRIHHEETLAADAELLTNLTDSIGFTLKSLGPNFVPIFEQYICPTFAPLLDATKQTDQRARLAAICLFDDVVEHCGTDAAARYGPVLLAAILQVIGHNDNGGKDDSLIDLQEAVVYGTAQLAHKAPPHILTTALPKLLPYLVNIAKEGQRVRGKEEIRHLRLVENAASAMATLCLFPRSPFVGIDGFDRRAALDVFLINLPLSEDQDEAKFCHEGLCDLAEDGTLDLKQPQNIQRLVNIVGHISNAVADDEDVASPETYQRLTHILQVVQNSTNNRQ